MHNINSKIRSSSPSSSFLLKIIFFPNSISITPFTCIITDNKRTTHTGSTRTITVPHTCTTTPPSCTVTTSSFSPLSPLLLLSHPHLSSSNHCHNRQYHQLLFKSSHDKDFFSTHTLAINNNHKKYNKIQTTSIRMSSSTTNDSNDDDNNNNNLQKLLPAPPFQYYSTPSIHNLDLSDLDATITTNENKRQEAFETSAKIKVYITKIRRAIEQQQQQQQSQQQSQPQQQQENENNKELLSNLNQELDAVINSTLASHSTHEQQQSIRLLPTLSIQFAEYTRIKAFQYFLSTGQLIPPSYFQLQQSSSTTDTDTATTTTASTISDEEYIIGAIIGLTHDLARYVIGRATVRDVHSVQIGCDLVTFCLDYLMTFDFRNGLLRRKYDSVKYALKTCETVLYELSVTGMDVGDNKEPQNKKQKIIENDHGCNDDSNDNDNNNPKMKLNNELEQLRLRIVHRDDLREKLIKRCRDAQKAAKQAIFALHRDDEKRCENLITECETIVQHDLNPMVEEDPSLYHGSYANVLEEYAEAKLFHSWLKGSPKGQILQPSDFTAVKLEPADYLGGLCDLTGEVGRYAVQRGTKRDSDGVHFCLDTNLSIVFALETLRHFPSGSHIYKKMDQLKQSVEKLERMLYELSLVKATGRQIVADSMKNKLIENDSNNNDGNQ